MTGTLEPARREVPTLTEIVSAGDRPTPRGAAPFSGVSPVDGAPSVLDAAELERRVLVELQCRLAGGLEGPLRATIEPLLGELAESLLREAQTRVVDTVRAMVREAVAQELALRQEEQARPPDGGHP